MEEGNQKKEPKRKSHVKVQASFEDGGREHESRKVDDIYKMESQRNKFFCKAPENVHPADTLIVAW